MAGPNILMYFPWSRPDEQGAPLGNLNKDMRIRTDC
jgi:hypothetical protein